MIIAQLIAKLQKLDPNLLVVLAADSEGNGYSDRVSIETGAYDRKNQEYGLAQLTPELESRGYSEEDLIHGSPCIVLFP